MPVRCAHPCEGLPAAAKRAFDVAAAGGVPTASKKTLSLLVERGLLEKHFHPHYFNDGLPPLMTYAYSVPVRHHIAWCEYWAQPRSPAGKRRKRSRPSGDDEPTLF